MFDTAPDDSFSRFRQLLNRYGRTQTPFVFIVDYKGKKPRVWRLDELDRRVLRFHFNHFSSENPLKPLPEEIYFHKSPLSFEAYEEGFTTVIRSIRAGDSFLVNYSKPTPIETNLTLEEIYERSNAPYRFWLKDQFVCFSPELFVTVEGNRISSYPMKGTLDASIPNAAQLLLDNPKEMAEHATIVDLIRNDLSRVARKVWVERYRYLETIETYRSRLLQVSSEIAGLLPDHFNGAYGDLLYQLLPAGSVTGAPKPSTLQIIEKAEGYERGYYTGVMGCFDGRRFTSAVMIRYIENTGKQLVFKSGGGITFQSDARSEYRELVEKVYLPFPIQASLPDN